MSHFQPEAMPEDIAQQPALAPADSTYTVNSCSSCGKGMALRDVRDYGLPGDMPRRVMKVVWWECRCGHREVVANEILA